MRLKNNYMIKVLNTEGTKFFRLPYLKIVAEFREEIKRVCGENYEPRVYSIIPGDVNNLFIHFALINTAKKSKRVVITDIAIYRPEYRYFSPTPFFFQDKKGNPENSYLSTKNILWESRFSHYEITGEEFAEIVKTL